MANTWGELSWSTGSWGQQNDVSVLLTGQQVNCAQNNVGTSTEINSGWGRLTWGENAWGIAGDVLVTGIGVSAGIGTGSVSIDVQPQLSGQQLNINLGQVQGFGLAEVFPNGIQLNTNLGTVDPAPDVMLTGIGLTASSGTVDAYNEQGWGRDTWGSEVWGASGLWAFAPVTGEQLNISQGEETAFTDVTPDITGQELTIAEGIVDPAPDATVTGIGMTVGLGLGTVTANANTGVLTGQQLNIAQGTAELEAVTFANVTGQQLNSSVGTAVAGASAEISPTGIGLTLSVNSINVQSWQIVNTGSSVTWNIIDTAA